MLAPWRFTPLLRSAPVSSTLSSSSTPLMATTLKKSAVLALAVLGTAAALVTGCKRPVEQADEQVALALKTGQAQLDKNADALAAMPQFVRAAGVRTASPAAQAQANMSAGDVEIMAADADLRKIEDQQVQLAGLIGRLDSFAAHVQANNLQAAGLAAREPKGTLAAMDKTTNAATAGENGVWIAGQSSAIPALQPTEKRMADLQAQVAAVDAKVQQLNAQRLAALHKAEDLNKQSEQAKLKQSADLFAQASDQRRIADDLAAREQDLGLQKNALNRELDLAKEEQKPLEAAIKKFGLETQRVNDAWKSTQQRIEAIRAASRAILEGGPEAGAAEAPTGGGAAPATRPSALPVFAQVTSVNDAAKHIAQVNAALQKLRASALGHLNKAEDYYAAASRFNAQVTSELSRVARSPDARQSPQHVAWDWILQLHTPSGPDLSRAMAEERKALLYSDQAYFTGNLLTSAKVLDDALKGAQLTTPATLSAADLDAQQTAARNSADAAFQAAENYLKAPIDNRSGPLSIALAQSATLEKMIEQYARYAFAKEIGQNAKANDYLATSKQLLGTLIEDKLALPLPLPPEITPAPSAAPRSTTPTRTPTPRRSGFPNARIPNTGTPNANAATQPAVNPTTTPATTPAAGQ